MKIVVIGGYGAFGRHLVTRLATNHVLEIVVAGRDQFKAQALVADLAKQTSTKARLEPATLDATTCTPGMLRDLGTDVVVNASGPFQAQNYHLAECAITAGCHSIDLADARGFVTGITELDAAASEAGVVVISGASTVPGISSAVIQHYRHKFSHLKTIAIAISPGNKFNPGVATTASILGYVGHPIEIPHNGKKDFVYGWQGLQRRNIPGIGKRWMGHVDVPDLDLLPAADAGLETVEMKAGLEVGIFHIGVWGLSWLVRAGLVKSLSGLAAPLLRVKQALTWLGSDTGGMAVALKGDGLNGEPLTVDWSLAAYNNHGPYIPTVAAQILVTRLAEGETFTPGARPCLNLISLKAFEDAVHDLDIKFTVAQQ